MTESIPNSTESTTSTEVQNVPLSTKVETQNPKTEKLTVNGKEVEVSIDELKRAYGLHKAAYSKMEEAAKIRKEADAIKDVYSQKDVNALLKAGWTEDEIEQKAADYIVKRAKEKSMSPEQRNQAQREQEYQRLKKLEEDRATQEKSSAQQALEVRETNLYQTALMSDIAKAGNNTWLDINNPVILSSILQDMHAALTRFDYDMPVAEAIKRQEDRLEQKGAVSKKYLRKLLKSSIKDIDDNDLDALLENGIKGIRDNSVAAVKKAEAPFAKLRSQTQSNVSPPAKPQELVRDANYYRKVKYGQIDALTGKPK